MVKTLPSHVEAIDSIPGQGAKTSHALGPKNQSITLIAQLVNSNCY